MGLAVLIVAQTCVAHAARFEKVALPQDTDTAAVEGTVRDSAGAPIVGARILLEEKGSPKTLEAKTDDHGAYVLKTDHAGTYTVRAGKAGWMDAVADAIRLSPGQEKQIDLILTATGPVNTKSSTTSASKQAPAGQMEFADEPNFTVAGVTDWSNLGLHGSAASSQTSEALAKQTLALKSGEPESPSGSVSESRYNAALGFKAKGEYAQARDATRKLLAATNDADGHRLLGELDEKLGDPLAAVREYQQAVSMDPNEQNYFDWGTELL
ncbi:MAG: carboxypeptidase regulatory-like domain-containing protein, partial [Chthoniobacterales bacterium]